MLQDRYSRNRAARLSVTQQEAILEQLRGLLARLKALEVLVQECRAALMLFGQAGDDLEERVSALERKADTGLVVPVGVQPS